MKSAIALALLACTYCAQAYELKGLKMGMTVKQLEQAVQDMKCGVWTDPDTKKTLQYDCKVEEPEGKYQTLGGQAVREIKANASKSGIVRRVEFSLSCTATREKLEEALIGQFGEPKLRVEPTLLGLTGKNHAYYWEDETTELSLHIYKKMTFGHCNSIRLSAKEPKAAAPSSKDF